MLLATVALAFLAAKPIASARVYCVVTRARMRHQRTRAGRADDQDGKDADDEKKEAEEEEGKEVPGGAGVGSGDGRMITEGREGNAGPLGGKSYVG